jgi:hypothetical protein
MATPCNKPLKGNPFVARRDPKTGQWQVIKQSPRKQSYFLGKIHPLHQTVARVTFQPIEGIRLQA